MAGRYILNGRDAVPCDDLEEWAVWCETADRTVAKTDVVDPNGETVRVSTVFLGLDHSFGGPIPMLFETLVFGGVLDQDGERYMTWDGAETGHQKFVDRVRSTVARETEEPAA